MRRAATALMVVLTCGCSVYDPDLLDGPACDARSVPGPPRQTGGDGTEVAFALRDVVFDQSAGRWSSIGYDIDGFCSADVESPRECTVPDGRSQPDLDGPGGVDNVFGHQVAPLVVLVHPEFELRTRERMSLGDGALLLRLFGWDGRDDDATVVAELSHTVVGTPELEDGSIPDLPEEGALPQPLWEGRDVFWSRDDDYLLADPEQPAIRDDHAHVADRQLVMRLPERAPLTFDDGERSLMMRMTAPALVARIAADGMTIDSATVVGRWGDDELLEAVQATGLCVGSPEYPVVTTLLDRVADVRSDVASAGRDLPCDAVSVGLAFTGTRARWAGITAGALRSHICAD